ncbi:hypothetical protein QX99_00971 [Weissella cibaria]|uniref:Uncharacterized protein n=1 Tax=Weissella cibaria TaxID=137591 RepID=A0A0D1LKH4_9LACO|nr:hypothetical protein QX99_00971 [Weissella cibaria]
MYANHEAVFKTWILSQGNRRHRNDDITLQFIETRSYRFLFVGAYLIFEKDSLVGSD